MELKNLIANNRVISLEYPGLDGFVIDIAYISRDITKNLMKKATTTSYNTKTRQVEEDVDSDLFVKLYSKQLIKGWKGLKMVYLEELLPVDLSDADYDEDAELEYSEGNAHTLMKDSVDFDNWITTQVRDIKNFNKSN